MVEEKKIKEAQGKPFLNIEAIPCKNLKLSHAVIEEVFQPNLAIEHDVHETFHVAEKNKDNDVDSFPLVGDLVHVNSGKFD